MEKTSISFSTESCCEVVLAARLVLAETISAVVIARLSVVVVVLAVMSATFLAMFFDGGRNPLSVRPPVSN